MFLKKYLIEDVYNELKDKKMKNGYILIDLIKLGLENLDLVNGVYVGDEESYIFFVKLFDLIIEEYYSLYKFKDGYIFDMNFEKIEVLDLDLEGRFICLICICVVCNFKGFNLIFNLFKVERVDLEKKIVGVLNLLIGDLVGMYYFLSGMDEKMRQQFVDDYFLFKKGDCFLELVGVNKEWLEGRGIFYNKNKIFLVWVNEED